MKKFLILIAFSIVALAAAVIIVKVRNVPAVPVHYHANFAVFENGKQVDFSKPEFMHISPCTDQDEISTDPKENVHLHDEVGNVVHLHAHDISWKIFFETIQYWNTLARIETEATKTDITPLVFLDGKEVPFDVLTKEISPRSHLLISIGSQSPSTDSARFQRELAAVGNNAADYDEGKIGVEHCGATGPRSIFQRFKIAFEL